jgi:glutaredoxin
MEDVVDPPIIKERNIFTVVVNKNNDLLVEEKPMEISELREAAVAFLDNGGGKGEDACDFCQGARDTSSSDNPEKAVISLKNDRETDYKVYIAVQNELVAAYNVLRNRAFARLYPNTGLSFVDADRKYSDPRTSPSEKEVLKPKLAAVKALFPQKLSEAEPSKTN